jgi:hypothetical protein
MNIGQTHRTEKPGEYFQGKNLKHTLGFSGSGLNRWVRVTRLASCFFLGLNMLCSLHLSVMHLLPAHPPKPSGSLSFFSGKFVTIRIVLASFAGDQALQVRRHGCKALFTFFHKWFINE